LLIGSLAAPALWGKNKIDRSRISAITDEIARSPEDAIAFARMYGLRNLELRDVPGQARTELLHFDGRGGTAAGGQTVRRQRRQYLFLNANLLKYGLPGTEPLRRTPETPESKQARIAREQARFERNEQDLRKSIRSAQILGCPYIRVFTFSRIGTAERVPAHCGDRQRVCEDRRAGRRETLIENETSCNVGTCAESRRS
jgi:hypothetical protein